MPSENRFAFTQAKVDALAKPDADITYWDETLVGFGLRHSSKGTKSYLVQYRIRLPDGKLKERQQTLGRADFLSVKEARKRAEQAKAKASAGIDVVGERKAAEAEVRRSFTLEWLIDEYVEQYANKMTRASTAVMTRSLLKRWKAKLGKRVAKDLKKTDVLGFLNDYRVERSGVSPAQCNHYLRSLGHVYSWAENRDLLEANPTRGIKPEKVENDRDRILTDAEIVAFWQACEQCSPLVRDIFRLLLLTGCRCAEIGGMRWTELDLPNRMLHLPGSRTKNKKAHDVWLSDLPMDILTKRPRMGDEGFVFSTDGSGPLVSFNHGKTRLQTIMGHIPGTEELVTWTPHDLRRTAASKMAQLNVQPHIIEKVINHQPASIRGVAAVYNRHQYLNERREALDKLGDHVAQLVGANVVKLRA